MGIRRRAAAILVVSAFLGLAASAAHAELPVAKMREAIDKGVDYLLARQEEDGKWAY